MGADNRNAEELRRELRELRERYAETLRCNSELALALVPVMAERNRAQAWAARWKEAAKSWRAIALTTRESAAGLTDWARRLAERNAP